MTLSLIDRGTLVETLYRAVVHGGGMLGSIPGLVRRVIETHAWEKRDEGGRIYEHATFLDFITAPPLAGCGWKPEQVKALISHDPDTLRMWDQAVTAQHGGNHTGRKTN